MISQEEFLALKQRALQFAFSSFTYLEYDSVQSYQILSDTKSLILLEGIKPEADIRDLQWAAKKPEAVITTAKSGERETLVTFIPPHWKNKFLENGFTEFGILREYWIDRLKSSYEPKLVCEPILLSEATEAVAVSQSCRLQSREFYGETKESILAWMTGCDPQAKAGGAKHETVLACRNGSKMVGIVSVAIYGFDKASGPIVWLREVAVLPEYQGEGFGKALVESALQYGVDHGATNAFLLADDCNMSAIALYRKVGFTPSEDDVQIDLVYQP